VDAGKKTYVLGAAAVVVLIGVGAWLFVAKAPEPAPVPAAPPAEPAPAVPAEPLPTLEDSDAWARARAAALSSDARFAGWLKNESLLQRWAAAVNMVGAGKVPVDALAFLRPRLKFVPIRAGGRLFVDPRSYARYDAAADAFASIDARAAASFCKTARPLLDRAWAGLGESGSVVDAVARAARELLAAPPAPERAELKPSEKGVVYVYADAALERLSPAQKQLMRMGPRGEAEVQAQVRALALACGASEAALK